MVRFLKKETKQQKEMQEDDFGQDLDFGIGICEDKVWAGKLLGQPFPICTHFLWYICH